MKFKKVIVAALALALLIPSTGAVFASPDTQEKTDQQMEICTSFEGFDFIKEDLKATLKGNDLKEALKLIEAVEKAKTPKDEEKAWQAFDAFYMTVDFPFIPMVFDDMKDFIKEDKQEEAKGLIEKINALEKAEKYEEADPLWMELDTLFTDDLMDFDMMDLDFEVFELNFEDMEDFIKEDKQEEAKNLIEKINAFETAEKYEEADALWMELDTLFTDDLMDFDMMDLDFEVYELNFEDMEDFIKEDKQEEAKNLIEKINLLDGEEKYEEADALWMELETFFVEDLMVAEDINLTDNQEKELDALFEKIERLESAGQYDEASVHWDAVEKIFQTMD